MKPDEVPPAAYCAHCHQGVHDQWRESAHSNSFRTPWYLKNIADLQADRGVAATRHCEGCHSPVALLTGALTAGSKVARPHDGDGVTCMVCHSIRTVETTWGLGSYTMGRPAVLVDAQNQPIPGLPSDREILEHLDWHRRAVSRPLYQTPEFCASCHKAAVPKTLNGYKWLRTFSAYDEWQQSSWSRETPLSFYTKAASATCQSCHMPLEHSHDPVAGKTGLAPSHRWLGATPRFRFKLPETATGVHLSASVRYRRFRRAFTDWVFDDTADAPDRFPTVTLATASRHLSTGINPAEGNSAAGSMETALRWNDYGIGMLDRQQFAEAAHAFAEVVRLQPRYEPGLVNVAIAECSQGRYPEALGWLDREHALTPQGRDARAEYYRGLRLRWQTHFDQAIAVLQPVAAQYPRFRQVHQELGYLYMVRRRFAESRDQYLAVLEVDPDDATAHRWLGPVYAALGDPARAAQEARITAQTGNDTAAGYVAQQYWRDHLDVAAEAMPRHTHSPGNSLDDADVRRVLPLQNPPSYIWEDHY